MLKSATLNRKGPWHDAGALLSWAALGAACAAQLAGEDWALALGLLLFLGGLAHGAGDEQGTSIKPFAAIHVLAYVLVGLAVAAVFLALPLGGLALFLALSAWHFARSDIAMAQLTRLAIAGLATGGSALFRHDGTGRVFAQILQDPPPALFTDILALFGIAGAGAAIYSFVRGLRGSGHAIIALIACVAFHPVLAVGVIFLTAHAIPIQQRQIARHGHRAVWRAVLWPTVGAGLGAAVIAFMVWQGLIELKLAVALAFGMATPHMLTERLER